MERVRERVRRGGGQGGGGQGGGRGINRGGINRGRGRDGGQLSKQVFAHLMSVLNQLVGRCGNLTVSALVLQGSDFMIDFCV